MAISSDLQFVERRLWQDPAHSATVSAFSCLKDLIVDLEPLVVPEKLDATTAQGERLANFAVQISLIGQVKAGKTALTNALLGVEELLPSDINPWTSVVTSIHLNQTEPRGKRAIFKFFTENEWAGMIETGGRMAKMAQKAGFDTEVQDMRSQITEMQEKTIKRLGKNFQLLLGSQHAFSEFSSDLIRRYVCLGDMDADKEGRFADMTRSADLYMASEHFDYPVTLVDTPGVNDPFLVREAATLNTLGNSDVCVIVLSAHQALSTSDLALMRILIGLSREQMVLFINRVDELSDPKTQIAEIDASIRETLRAQDLQSDIPIIFGSAAWGGAQVTGRLSDLPGGSAEALSALAATHDADATVDLSGLSELQRVLAEKATLQISTPFLRDTARSALDLAKQSRAVLNKSVTEVATLRPAIDIIEVEAKIQALGNRIVDEMEAIEEKTGKSVLLEMSGIFNEFIFNASRSLSRHLERGKVADWVPETDQLRRALNAVYRRRSKQMQTAIEELAQSIHDAIADLYTMFDTEEDDTDFGLSKPPIEAPGTPVSLMRTMTVDLSGGWLSGWLAPRRRRETHLRKFKDLTLAEMKQTSEDVRDAHVTVYCSKAKADLAAFVTSHLMAMQELAKLDDGANRDAFRERMGKGDSVEVRVMKLNAVIRRLEDLVDGMSADLTASEIKVA